VSGTGLPPNFPAPSALHRSARLLALGLSPVLVAQGRYVRHAIPRLPHAPEPWHGERAGPQPVSVLGLGDSTIAGVGVLDPLDGLVAQFSLRVHEELSRGVRWRAVGRSGATTKDLLGHYLPATLAEPADLVFVSIGANDAKNLVSLKATVERFERLLSVLHAGHPTATLIFSSLPAFHLFRSLPQPLRAIIRAHSQAIERSVRPIIEAAPWAIMSPPPPGYHETFFAEDGFHPSVDGYRDWAQFALRDALERGALDHLLPR